jgi:hypothetical protein
MESVCIKLVSIIDRLAHHSTTDQDALQTVYGLRRVAKGAMPSKLLHLDDAQAPKSQQITSLKRQIAILQAEKAQLATANSELQQNYDRLKAQVDLLQARNDTAACQSRPIGADYTYAEVMEIIREKFGKQNGGLRLWADYSARLHAADPTSRLLTVSKLQSWRTAGRYPDWAVQQLLAMPATLRVSHKWSDDDVDYLCKLHLANPQKTDDQLAAECSKRFGCEVNSNSIKSKFNILRKLGRIPRLRPAKTR